MHKIKSSRPRLLSVPFASFHGLDVKFFDPSRSFEMLVLVFKTLLALFQILQDAVLCEVNLTRRAKQLCTKQTFAALILGLGRCTLVFAFIVLVQQEIFGALARHSWLLFLFLVFLVLCGHLKRDYSV